MKILDSVYERVETLDTFLRRLMHPEKAINLRQTGDKTSYINLLETTLVATPAGVFEPSTPLSSSQLSKQNDVVLRTVEKLKLKQGSSKTKNVLTMGYGQMSNNPYTLVSSSAYIESFYPNQNTDRLQQHLWRLLLQRTGDDVMTHMLETRALYLAMDNGCYIQTSGTPLYEMWPYRSHHVIQTKPSKAETGSRRKHKKGFIKFLPTRKKRNSKVEKLPQLPILPPKHIVLLQRQQNENYRQDFQEQTRTETARLHSKRKRDSHVSVEDLTEPDCEDETTYKKPRLDTFTYQEDSMIPTLGWTGSSNNSLILHDSISNISLNERVELEQQSPLLFSSNSSTGVANFKSPCTHSDTSDQITSIFWSDSVDIHNHEGSFTDFSDEISCGRKEIIQNLSVASCTPNSGDEEHEKASANKKFSVRGNTPFNRTHMFYARYLREKYPDVHTSRLMHKGSEALMTNMLQTKIEGTVQAFSEARRGESERNISSGDGLPEISPVMRLNLCGLFQKLLLNLKKTRTNQILSFLEQSHPGSVLQKHQRIKRARMSMNISDNVPVMKTTEPNPGYCPSLAAPVFHRNNKTKTGSQRLLSQIISSQIAPAKDLSSQKSESDQKTSAQTPAENDIDANDNGSRKIKTYAVSGRALSKDKLMKTSEENENRNKKRKYEPKLKIVRGSMKTKKIFSDHLLGKKSIGQLLKLYTPLPVILSFVDLVIKKIVPIELLGTAANRKILIKGAKKFVRMGRFEKFYLGNLLSGVKMKKIPWLSSMRSVEEKRLIVAKLISWLFLHLVISLLKSHFYITDTTMYRNKMFYYRKSVWKTIKQKAVQNHLKNGIMKPITKAEASRLLSSGISLGVAQLRFRPKTTTLRPIVNMGRSCILASRKGTKGPLPPINRQLQSLLSVLTFEKQQDPSLLGSSKFGLDDIYSSWREFVMKRRKRIDNRPLYFVKVDIEHCYDSIHQDKLYTIIESILHKREVPDYVVRRHCTVQASGGRLRREFVRTVSDVAEYRPDFVRFTKDLISRKKLRNTVFVDQVLYDHDDADGLLKLLRAHLLGNIIQIGGDYYLQLEGLSQGSILSTLLCNYYYAAMERRYLHVAEDELLMRQTDDFLFVSPCRENAERFLKTMVEGIPEYGCKVNPQKTLTNFTSPQYDTKVLQEGDHFLWCGVLFDTQSLEARVDYSGYYGLSVREIFTPELQVQPGMAMVNKLSSSLRLKCHGMFMDHEVNRLPVLIENAFNMFLLVAFKFHFYVKQLPPCKRVHANPRFFTNVIYQLPGRFAYYMRSKTDQHESSPMNSDVTHWICVQAFLLKLGQHAAMYKPLLRHLRNRLRQLNKLVAVPKSARDAIPNSIQGYFAYLQD